MLKLTGLLPHHVEKVKHKANIHSPHSFRTNPILHKSTSVAKCRTLIDNMVVGVSKGFDKRLLLVGVGYRAQMEGNDLVLFLGFSHPVRMPVPEGLKVKVEENTRIIVSGYNKQTIGEFAAAVRKWRPPEPYKGKGIRYVDEVVRKKEGKAGKKK
jgi:large subunit ribosomal protein L6